ncbi:serine/threonine protein kinase [Streptomyces kanamyceticus]|uniref:Serine/threonine protein kinase n=2 Tax=Streptomyces kanamyceticus TaxID=1967 RepID=A0A5J6G5T2_STRKN|nr:serine/threonine-protein kinase [Streptomyces kanamyceticus]QEU90919.1 serine/threonine protein kinase [Streptomyces kanamyceticus]
MTDANVVFPPLGADDPHVVAGYRLAARIGAGGMGRVYLSHTQGGRPVAIKVVRSELADDPDFRRRFRREMEAARRVRGAYTAELIDGDADGAPPWLATLYVPGPSLSEAVGRRGPLPVRAVLWLVAGVAEALQAIHDAGVVHRDLKPSNVLLSSDGPRVIDFGISLASGVSSYTATGAAVGTPQFMAPEQASGGSVTTATDVFALGQTAAFAALGESLYGDGPAVSVLYRIVHSAPDLSLLPEQLRPLIARCMAADPAERATPAEIIDWCRQHLGQEAEEGAGPTVWRAVIGPEPTVPSPVTAPAPAPASPLPTRHLPPGSYPTAPDAAPPRRRRTGLVAAAAVTAGVLVLTALAWTVMDATDVFRGRDKDTASGARHADTSANPLGKASGSGSKSGSGSSKSDDADAEARDESNSSGESGRSGGSGGSGEGKGTSRAPASAADSTRGEAHPGQWLDAKTSVSLKEPTRQENLTGDIRFTCAQDAGCALESDTSVLLLRYAKPGADLDKCRFELTGAKEHRLPLAAAAAGSEICVKHRNGDIALLVVQVKSTAVPDIAFLTADMTVWHRPN